jgi:hypothetical protein
MTPGELERMREEFLAAYGPFERSPVRHRFWADVMAWVRETKDDVVTLNREAADAPT